MSDLVERLRDLAINYNLQTIDDAADEIEALRSALAESVEQKPVGITDDLICKIIDEADKSFRHHQRSIRGQMITVWDSKEAYIAAAAIKLTAPAVPEDCYINCPNCGELAGTNESRINKQLMKYREALEVARDAMKVATVLLDDYTDACGSEYTGPYLSMDGQFQVMEVREALAKIEEVLK